MGLFNLFSKKDNRENVNPATEPAVHESERYIFLLRKYDSTEKKVISKADTEIERVIGLISSETEPIRKSFLQSYVDHYKTDYISRMNNFFLFRDESMIDELDPLFTSVAERIVREQSYSSMSLLEWYNYNLDVERQFIIERQLFECGVIDKDFEGTGCVVCVNNQFQLNKLLKVANGRSLLSIEEKKKLNEHINQRFQELVGDQPAYGCLEPQEDTAIAYSSLISTYDALSSCDKKWEIVSSQENLVAKSSANTLVDRKSIHYISKKSFNFLKPLKEQDAPFFAFKEGGLDIYIYPEFFIASRSATDFDIIKIEDAKVLFHRQNFVETSNVLLPKDAKLVKFTYKYVNANGSKDARFSNNPRYPVYEYGDLTFSNFNLTIQFSNSDNTADFFNALCQLISGDTVGDNKIFSDVTKEFFDKADAVVRPLRSFYDNLKKEKTIMTVINGALPASIGDVESKLRLVFIADIIKCYEHLGHDATKLNSKEGLMMLLFESHTLSSYKITYDILQHDKLTTIVEGLNHYNKTTKDALLKDKPDDLFYMKDIFNVCGRHDLKVQYFSLLYRFYSVVAKADDNVTPEESKWLESIMSFANEVSKDEEKPIAVENIDETTGDSLSDTHNDGLEPMEELQSLIGLSEVKEEVTALANFVKIQKEREKNGIKSVGISYHCVFTGNPGTGKTTVARILANIYKNLGIIKKGHLVETDRSGLVAEYVGQTAIKTNKIIDSAIDGVLFIDEAYSLVQGGGNDFGQEAIATLLKRIEDDRDRLIVILAGYSEDMKQFIDSNPGLQSRFNRYIHFSDYTSDELKSIFLLNAKKNQYELTDECQKALSKLLLNVVEHKDKNFGNGRFVRNLFEKAIQKQAIRLSKQPSVSVESLSMLEEQDLP